MPQLGIQIFALYYSATESDIQFDISSEMITVLSLVFTSISIGLSVGEYFLSRQLLKSDSYVIASFKVNSSDIETMSHHDFRDKILFQQKVFLGEMAKLLEIDYSQIELVKPTRTQKGAIFVLHINHGFHSVRLLLSRNNANNTVAQVSLRVHAYYVAFHNIHCVDCVVQSVAKGYKLSQSPSITNLLVEQMCSMRKDASRNSHNQKKNGSLQFGSLPMSSATAKVEGRAQPSGGLPKLNDANCLRNDGQYRGGKFNTENIMSEIVEQHAKMFKNDKPRTQYHG